ncbi:copper chaperone [Peribacillus saganii]|uniref:Copper chaperone n=1 Tax=Peribacillus saganii TaxID=2303992 RepID=A0A372LNH9_9BACI|nr:copper chaperone [Peribacillus saganii]RFU67698.1 copper chaperone [Peribacillus saganii]
METGMFVVKDMVSQEDANTIMNALLEVWGVSRAEVNLSKGEAMFTYDKRMASAIDFEQAILDSGYQIAHDQHNPGDNNNLVDRGESDESM